VYAIIHVTSGKCYIGSSKQTETRWWRHLNDLDNGKHDNQKLQRAWNKHGSEAFVFAILEVVSDQICNYEREQYFLDTYLPCYNIKLIARGSNGKGWKHSEEAKAKMSASKKGVPTHSQTPETRAKIGASNKGKLLGITMTKPDGFGKKISQARQGMVFSEEHRCKISERLKGHKYCVGRVISPETRRKISESLKARSKNK
jgi:group I intron endonuclease